MTPGSRRFMPSPTACLAVLALFISLGGTTYAVTALPENSVGNEQLRDRAVTEDKLSSAAVITRKLANGAVTGRKIGREAIGGSRLAADTLTGLQIDEGALSTVPLAADAERAKLALRATVADRVEHVELAERATQAERAQLADVADALSHVDVNFDFVAVREGITEFFVVECDVGLVPVGGGFLQADDFGDVGFLIGSAPFPPASWAVEVQDGPRNTGQPTPAEAYAICVKADAG